MAFCELYFHSLVLQKAVAMNVILPELPGEEGPFPVLYLLHGLSDDHSIWHRRTRIEYYVRDLPIIVVMPDGGRSFYCNAVDGQAYETYFVKDVIGFVDRCFPTIASREGRAIGGLSIGGYGAMKLALKFPDMFRSVASHSGSFNVARRTPRQDLQPELIRIFGENAAGSKDDLFSIAGSVDRSKLPAIRFDCGVDDFLLEDNREFHAHLEKLSIPHEYDEYPGEHNWDFWDEHVQEAIAFHVAALEIKSRQNH